MPRNYLRTIPRSGGNGRSDLLTEELLIGREKYLGWPVDAYRVFVPIVVDDPLASEYNPFERLIIAILRVEDPLVNSDRALASQTCLPDDFVHDIMLRLRGKGLVAEDAYKLTESAKNSFDELSSKEANGESIEMRTALVFREAVSGRMLPNFLPLEGETFETLDYDEISKKSPIVLERAAVDFPAPTKKDVRHVLRECRKRNRDLGGVVPSTAYNEFDILESRETYYLLCPIGVRRSDVEERIIDPFGLGYSLILENAFDNLLDENERLAAIIENWKKQLENQQAEQRQKEQAHKFPFDVERVSSRYPHLAVALKTAYTRLEISDMFSAFEWALHYHFAEDVESIVLSLQSLTPSEYRDQVEETLRSRGWKVSNRYKDKPQDGRIKALEAGTSAHFPSLFSLMLNREGGRWTTLATIARKYPKFPEEIEIIRNYRNAKGHGAWVQRAKQLSFNQVRIYVEGLISTVLKDVEFNESFQNAAITDQKTDEKIRAVNDLHNSFGRRLLRECSGQIREHMIEAQIEFNGAKDGEASTRLVREVASTMQAMLEEALKDIPRRRERDPFEASRLRLLGFGFDSLSESYRGLNPDRISKGMEWKTDTLGVAGLILAISAMDDDLESIASRFPGMFNFIAEVHDLRGHDRQVTLTGEERASLKVNFKRFVETLMEVFHG